MPAPLAPQALCLDHFIEQASTRLQEAAGLCELCQPVGRQTLEWLLAEADAAARALSQNGHGCSPAQRTELLELLLGLANLQEHLRHHLVRVKPAG